MRLQDADDQPAVGEDATVRISERMRLARIRRDRPRLGAGPVDSIETAVVEAGAEDDLTVPEPRTASVLVDPRSHVEVRGDDVDGLAVVRFVHERGSPILVRTALGPVDTVLADVDIAELNTALAGRELRRDRRDPGPVRRRGCHGVQRIELEDVGDSLADRRQSVDGHQRPGSQNHERAGRG